MPSYIKEFLKAEKPEGYYEALVESLHKANREYNAFNVIDENVGQSGNAMPFSTKSNICVKGVETTAGSKMLKGYIPPFNATVVERLLDSGRFAFIGETNMDEFGFGTFGVNAALPARNAFDKNYVAGGSSSGAAVATAMLKYHVALAVSTGGSISAPAALNGVVGFTPTYGTVSRYGLIDYANSLDKIGVMARNSDDARIVFDAMRGGDGKDLTCAVGDIGSKKKKKLFVIEELDRYADKTVRANFSGLLDRLSAKYDIETRNIGALDVAVEAYYILAMAEASTNLARYDGYKYGLQLKDLATRYNEFFTEARANFGEEAKRRILLGTFIRSESVKAKYYTKAARIRAIIIKRMGELLKEGFIVSPAFPMQTPKISEVERLTPVQTYATDIFTVPPNLGGFPHITFPYHYQDGMPMGAQIIGEHANDYALIDFVGEWEGEFDYRYKHNIGSL